MVIMFRIGQSAVLFPNLVMAEYGKHSETERVLVGNDKLATLNQLKIQSGSLGDLGDVPFDGDEMNAHVPQDVMAELELEYLAAVPNNIISPATNSPIIGFFQDSLLGAYLFTRSKVNFNEKNAMNLLMKANNINLDQLFYGAGEKDKKEKKNLISSFDIITQIMPPISLFYKQKGFNSEKDNIKTSDAVVEIVNGHYIRGQMDKSVLGGGTKGLIHMICNTFGNMKGADFIDDMQNIVNTYMKTAAFSVGVADLISNDKTKNEIIQIITNKKIDVKNLTDQVMTGVFENNTGKTNQEEYETQVNNILNQASSESGKVGLKSLGEDNRFVMMVKAGSKGSDLNISFMVACVGQQNVDGKRVPYGFDHRTLPHFQKFDDSPEARGFVESSYINGLSPQELFFHAMGGRVGLIDTAVKSVTWETPIILMENGHSVYTEIGRWIDAKLDLEANKSTVQHFKERNMELLNVGGFGDENKKIFIPTTDDDGRVTWGEITAVTRHDPGEVLYEMKTQGGRSVIVTESKSLLVWYPEKKQFLETSTPDIKIGDGLPVTGQLMAPPVITEWVDMGVENGERFYFNKENMYKLGYFISNRYLGSIQPNLLLFFNKWATNNGNKIIPNELLQADKEAIEYFIDAINITELLSKNNTKIIGDDTPSNHIFKFDIESNKIIYLLSRINLCGRSEKTDKEKYIWVSDFYENKTHNDIVIDPIVEINLVDVKDHPKVYDLTIPSTLNFGLANGLQVRDTSQTGYIQRRLIKGLEDLMVNYDHTVRTNKNKIVQFAYGDDGIDTIKTENQPVPFLTNTYQEIYAHFYFPDPTEKGKETKAILNAVFTKQVLSQMKKQQTEIMAYCDKYTQQTIYYRDEIIKNVFKYKNDNTVTLPVAFMYVISNIKGQLDINQNSMVDISPMEVFLMIEKTFDDLQHLYCAPPTELFKALYYYYLSPKDLLIMKRFNRVGIKLLLETIKLQYKKSIVAPGEMVGMIAGQSLGEVSTQMSVSYSSQNKIVRIKKSTGEIFHQSVKIGEFCDKLISENPALTFGTGHENSVETLLEGLEDEYYIVGVDEKERTAWNRISHVSRHPVNGQMMRVKTRCGREVETTTSHSHLVRCGETQKVVPIVGANMTVGMRIPVAKYIENAFIKDIVEIGGKTYKLDNAFGWFIGAYLSEGNVNKNDICITNIADHYIESVLKIAKLFEREGGVKRYKGEYGPGVTTHFGHKDLSKFIVETCGTGSFVKRVPDFAFTAPNEFKAGLFQGYFDGDGNFQCDATHHQMRACSRSEQLIKDLALILNYFNIFGTIKKENNTRGSALFHLNISPKYARQYMETIGTELHKEVLNNIIAHIERGESSKSKDCGIICPDRNDKINGLGHIIARCGKVLGFPGQSRDYGHYAKKESIGRRTLEKYLPIFEQHPKANLIQEELAIIRQAVSANVIWDEIVSIELYTPTDPKEQMVYDFTVPGNQTFMTDYGVIVHNTLNTFHFSGVASKSNVTRGVPRMEEILGLSENPKNSSLTIYLKKEDQTQKNRAQTIMNLLEYTKMKELVKTTEICFDPDDLNTLIEEDRPLIAQYKEFENMVNECSGGGTEFGEDEENVKSKWVIRMEMDAETMLDKNITMDDIHYTLSKCYDDQISCIYSDYNADKLIFRIRMNEFVSPAYQKKSANKKSLDQTDHIYILKNIENDLLNNIIIRGVKNIKKVILRKQKNYLIEQNGVFVNNDVWLLDTIGTNLLDVLALDFIDKNKTFSNDIIETYNILGIEAARQAIYNELADVIEFGGTYVNYHHFSILCDRMTFTHKLISIFRHGINNDDIGPIAKASFEETPQMFLDAAQFAELDIMKGVSANVMFGQEGFYGTSAFQLVLDMEEMGKIENTTEYKKLDREKEISQFFQSTRENDADVCSISNLTIQNNVNNIRPEEMGELIDEYEPGF